MLKNKPYKTCKVGEWVFDFYYQEGNIRRTYLKITSTSGIMSLFLGGNTHAYGYLLAAAKQDRLDQLQGYAVTLYVPAMAMTQDAGLTADVQKAITKWMKRKDAEAKSEAKNITDALESANQAFMEEVVERSQMSKKEAKATSEADKKLMKETLTETENGE